MKNFVLKELIEIFISRKNLASLVAITVAKTKRRIRETMNLINAKVYYDGSHWIAIPHTERPFRRRRAAEKIDNSEKVIQFEQAFKKTPKGKRVTKRKSY